MKIRFFYNGRVIANPARDVPLAMERAIELQDIDRAEMAAICSRLITDESARELFQELTGLEVVPNNQRFRNAFGI